jgi:hypothetical protein
VTAHHSDQAILASVDGFLVRDRAKFAAFVGDVDPDTAGFH